MEEDTLHRRGIPEGDQAGRSARHSWLRTVPNGGTGVRSQIKFPRKDLQVSENHTIFAVLINDEVRELHISIALSLTDQNQSLSARLFYAHFSLSVVVLLRNRNRTLYKYLNIRILLNLLVFLHRKVKLSDRFYPK